MLDHAVLVRGSWMEFLYLCRAEFSGVVNNGIRMPFLNNTIEN